MVTIDNGEEGGQVGKDLLHALDESRVFNVTKTDDGRFCFQESCDRWFSAKLTKEQVLALAEELRTLACGA